MTMQLDDIYDSIGKDGQENKAAYEKLPKILQYFISSQQKLLVERVKKMVFRRFGEAGIKDLVKTSGFRSVTVNTRHNGVLDSLHLWGCAADFAKRGIFATQPIPVCPELQIIDSGTCWHIQFRRP